MHPEAVEAYQTYLLKSSQFQRTTRKIGTAVPRYAILEADDEPLFPFVETAKLTCGFPLLLKSFSSVQFHGYGTLFVRAFIAGAEVARGWVSLTPGPLASDTFRFPEGTAGVDVVLQIAGTGSWSHAELIWDPVGVQP